MSLVIALTGGIGSGKSSVASMLADFGAGIVDTDEIAHALTAANQPAAQEIGRQFGAEYLSADGALERDRMRALVFADPAAKRKLESILHPRIRRAVADALATVAAPYVVLVVPLLVETGAYSKLAQRVLVVDCDESQQVERVMQRDGLSRAAVAAIMANQVSRTERLRHADDIIVNRGDLTALCADASALHRKYLELAAGAQTADQGDDYSGKQK